MLIKTIRNIWDLFGEVYCVIYSTKLVSMEYQILVNIKPDIEI